MSFCEFFITGISFQKGIYNFETYKTLSKKPPDVEKIKKLWNRINTYTNLLLITTLGGIVGGSVFILGSTIPLFGVALLTASVALTVFILFRSRAAKNQVEQWKNYIPPRPAPTKPAFDPYVHLREPLARFLEYYNTLVLPTENTEPFLNDFFDENKNPLRGLYIPEDLNKEVFTAQSLYAQLKIVYDFLPRDLRIEKQSQLNKIELEKTKFNDSLNALCSYCLVTIEGKMNLTKIYRDSKKCETIKKYMISYVETTYKTWANQTLKLIENSFTKFELECFEKERKTYLNTIYNTVVSLIECLKKKDFSSYSPLIKEKFELTQRWECPEYKIPIVINIPYNSEQLIGITETEYRDYLN